MEIKILDDAKFRGLVSRYDLNYGFQRAEKWLEVTSTELSENINDIKTILDKENISALQINNKNYYLSIDLSNLTVLSSIKQLGISSGKIVNSHCLSNLTQLEALFLYDGSDSDGKLDLSYLTNLRYLKMEHYNKNIVGIMSLKKLDRLSISKLKEKDMLKFSYLPLLESLEIIKSDISSLEFIKSLSRLKCLTLYYCPKLSNISYLTQDKTIEFVEFMRCTNIFFPNKFASDSLKYISFTLCSSIPNLNWISSCKNLDGIWIMDTNVEDGDLTKLVQVPNFGFYPNKKHYNYYVDRDGNVLKR